MKDTRHLPFSFLLFWLSQSVSQLGSAMTSFALTIWAYQQTGSATAVSLMAFCTYLPWVAVGLFCGGFIDSHHKRSIMLWSDGLAALCSLAVALLWATGTLQIQHIYLVNAVIGLMNAFQSPAQTVAIGILVPADARTRASGMSSLAGNLTAVVAPMAAAALLALGGLGLVIAVDLLTFLAAFLPLWLLISVPEQPQPQCTASPLAGCRQGLTFLRRDRKLLTVVLTMALINFFSRLTYENILSPMILARSGGSAQVLGQVTAVIGIGGIIGGLAVSLDRRQHDCMRMIYLPAVCSFLCGDLLMAVGRGPLLWCLAGLAASLPVPVINAGSQALWYQRVPLAMQGRVFAVRGAIQWCTIPVVILSGGLLADRVLEPFMAGSSAPAHWLQALVGRGPGSGMAVLFLCTGLLGGLSCLLFYRLSTIKKSH